jgi:hypothetical protein
MKKFLIALNIVIWSVVGVQLAHAADKPKAEKVCKTDPETKKETCTKKICKTDEKTKKETCKTIKIHEKLEGTAVPVKK